MLQLSPSIPLMTPHGSAEAVIVIDYSKEDDLMWVCINDSDGAVWTWPNSKIRGIKNITVGRTLEVLKREET